MENTSNLNPVEYIAKNKIVESLAKDYMVESQYKDDLVHRCLYPFVNSQKRAEEDF